MEPVQLLSLVTVVITAFCLGAVLGGAAIYFFMIQRQDLILDREVDEAMREEAMEMMDETLESIKKERMR